ncbi:MAG TPA: hypothetical protein VK907_11805 [Phnomibacter sp.]|nr:hypothetical protein [Phnomibacter sp.]
MKKIILLSLLSGLIIAFTACYKNRYDVTEFTRDSIETVSLTKDVAPILISGGCGCHNNGTTRQFWFSNRDTIYYETMVAKAPMLDRMAKGENHPAEGSVFFTPSQASIVRTWVAQGAKNDAAPPAITGPIGYQQHIVPLYKQNCTGGQCHGGLGPVLDYTSLKNNESKMRSIMNSLGRSGHTPVINISQATATVFIAWMDGGFQP